MDDEGDEQVDFHVIEAAIRPMGGLRPTDEDHPVSLLVSIEDAIDELLKLEKELSDIIEQQVERRALLIESEKMTAAEFSVPITGALERSRMNWSAARFWKYLRLQRAMGRGG